MCELGPYFVAKLGLFEFSSAEPSKLVLKTYVRELERSFDEKLFFWALFVVPWVSGLGLFPFC